MDLLREQAKAGAERPQSTGVRERIIECATDLLGREGCGALSVSAVCKLAGVSAPSIYWHFGNKEGLLAAVLKGSLRRDADTFLAIDITRLTRRDAFKKYLAALRRIVVSERPNSWVILSSLSELRHAAPEIIEIIAEARRLQVEYNEEQLRTLWGLHNSSLFVHLWLAFCNYLSLLYQDTKSEALVDDAIEAFRKAYFLLVAALSEEGINEDGFAEIMRHVGYEPWRPRAGARPQNKRSRHTSKASRSPR